MIREELKMDRLLSPHYTYTADEITQVFKQLEFQGYKSFEFDVVAADNNESTTRVVWYGYKEYEIPREVMFEILDDINILGKDIAEVYEEINTRLNKLTTPKPGLNNIHELLSSYVRTKNFRYVFVEAQPGYFRYNHERE